MSRPDETPRAESFVEQPEPSREASALKKPFVEPEVSVPVDVLEATTFFQPVDTGGVPPPVN